MIWVSFCRSSNGLLNEMNLFWRYSSPLRILLLQNKLQNKVQFLGHLVHDHFNQNSSVDFTVLKGRVKYALQLCFS